MLANTSMGGSLTRLSQTGGRIHAGLGRDPSHSRMTLGPAAATNAAGRPFRRACASPSQRRRRVFQAGRRGGPRPPGTGSPSHRRRPGRPAAVPGVRHSWLP